MNCPKSIPILLWLLITIFPLLTVLFIPPFAFGEFSVSIIIPIILFPSARVIVPWFSNIEYAPKLQFIFHNWCSTPTKIFTLFGTVIPRNSRVPVNLAVLGPDLSTPSYDPPIPPTPAGLWLKNILTLFPPPVSVIT